jgi:hypothetical protein
MLAFDQHFTGDGASFFASFAMPAHSFAKASSQRLGSHYRSGRVDHWLKIKNAAASAVRREAEEELASKRWGRGRRRT